MPLWPRSNKPLTEFACVHLASFLSKHYRSDGQRTKGNTSVVYEIGSRVQVYKVLLFGEEILRVTLDDWKPVSVWVCFTSFYDDNGWPTNTVRERLNGLLDCLGAYQVIPDAVRIFVDQNQGLTYLGAGDNKIAVGERYEQAVFIGCSMTTLSLEGSSVLSEVVNV